MYLLIAYIKDAFLGWRVRAACQPEEADALDLAVVKAAAKPLDGNIAAKAISASSFNPDYFLRGFKKARRANAQEVSGVQADGTRYALP